MQERALYGLSIGCTVGEFTRGTKPNEPRRTIKAIKSPPEASLTTFPMNELAGTGAVKTADIRTVRDFEDALRELLGSSHAAAKSMAQHGFKAANEKTSRLDSFVASPRDVRWQIQGVRSGFAPSGSSPIADIAARDVQCDDDDAHRRVLDGIVPNLALNAGRGRLGFTAPLTARWASHRPRSLKRRCR
jgi:hypothetical protein